MPIQDLLDKQMYSWVPYSPRTSRWLAEGLSSFFTVFSNENYRQFLPTRIYLQPNFSRGTDKTVIMICIRASANYNIVCRAVLYNSHHISNALSVLTVTVSRTTYESAVKPAMYCNTNGNQNSQKINKIKTQLVKNDRFGLESCRFQ